MLPPNGSRLSCGRLARRRKGVGRESVPARAQRSVPLKRSPPGSFKRLLGAGSMHFVTDQWLRSGADYGVSSRWPARAGRVRSVREQQEQNGVLNAMGSRRDVRTPGSDGSSNSSVESRIGRGQDLQLRDVRCTGTVEADAELNESTEPGLTEELRIDRV